MFYVVWADLWLSLRDIPLSAAGRGGWGSRTARVPMHCGALGTCSIVSELVSIVLDIMCTLWSGP